MRYTIKLLTLAMLATLGIAVMSAAQADRAVELLRAELDRTDQIIERAETEISSSGNQAAMTALDQAKDLQSQARDQFALGTPAGYLAARKVTLLARQQVVLALKLIGGTRGNTEQQDDFVLRKLESAANLMDRALESLATGENRNLEAIADAAKQNLDRAWEFYRNQQYRPALKLAEQVEKAATRILTAGELKEFGREEFERLSSTIGQLIETVRQQMADCNSETGMAYLTEAEQAYQLAQDLYDRERVGAALQALQRARELAMKAGRECRGLDRLQARYDQLLAELNRLKNESTIPENAVEAFNRLLAQAEDQLSLAHQNIGENNWQQAALALQAAQLSIRQAEELLNPTG
jgi:tetratricopeptide (TPR) repeat protein